MKKKNSKNIQKTNTVTGLLPEYEMNIGQSVAYPLPQEIFPGESSLEWEIFQKYSPTSRE